MIEIILDRPIEDQDVKIWVDQVSKEYRGIVLKHDGRPGTLYLMYNEMGEFYQLMLGNGTVISRLQQKTPFN